MTLEFLFYLEVCKAPHIQKEKIHSPGSRTDVQSIRSVLLLQRLIGINALRKMRTKRQTPALSAADVGIAINSGAAIAREIADVTIKADSLEELVVLKTIANSLQRRVSANYRFVLTFNSALIALGAMGILQPASSAMLHNLSTIGISLKSMTNLIPEEKAQKALTEKN